MKKKRKTGDDDSADLRKRAEEALQQSELRYRALFDGSSNPIAVYDRDGSFLMINSLGAGNFRKPAAEIVGKSLKEFLPDVYEPLVERIRRVIDQKENFQAEDLIELPGGEERWFWSTLEPVKNVNGVIYGVQVISYDITERKRAEEALQRALVQLEQLVAERTEKLNRTNEAFRAEIAERKRAEEAVRKSEEKYRGLTENINLGIYRNTVGPEGKFIEANPATIGMFGYKSKEEFLAINVSDLYQNAADRNKFNDKMLKEGFVRGEELWLKKKDGSLFVGSVSAVAVKDKKGHVKYYDGIIDNITERKRVEDDLRFTRLSLDNAADTMVCVGYDGRFVDVNDAFCRSVGYSREELLSKTVHDIDPDYSGEVWPEFWKKLKESGSLTFESCHHTKTGKVIPVEITAKFFEHNGKEYHCGFAHDITERKRAEEEIRRKAKDLQEKNAELTRFIYAVSHDLRSPLVTIQTFQGHLERDIRSRDAARVEKDLGYIRNAADKMGRLLDDIRRLSRVGRIMNPSEEAPLQAIVKEALDLVAGRINRREVQVELTEEPVVLYGDRTRLVEIFINLVDNAVKFMGDEPAPRVEIGVEKAGEELVLHVRDNGIGIDPKLQPMLFGLFHKLDPQTEGEGIGLALVKQIVELHGGRIWVESAGIDTGATFRFTLAKTRRKRGREETP